MQIRIRREALCLPSFLFVASVAMAVPVQAQENADSTTLADSVQAAQVQEQAGGFPIFGVLGFGYGTRTGDCVLCASPQDNRSFVGHLSVGRPLGRGFGVGIDASVWIKGRPGTPGAADSTGAPVATSLRNMLGNASVSFSYDYWHLFVKAGFGMALGRQDLEFENPDGHLAIQTASGMGIGYTVGGGVTLPLASMVSLAFFGNLNVGYYDMISPQGLSERGAKHQWMEFGVGAAVR